jgi:hypothetical protein
MSRKDYCLIAGAIRQAMEHDDWDSLGSDAIPFGITLATDRIADALASDNPRFNRDRFYEAAGVEQQ